MRYIIVVLFFLITSVTLADEEDSNPYIQYYSPFLNSYIIERADGSDSRLFGRDLIAPSERTQHAGWSPSGKWYAGLTVVDDTVHPKVFRLADNYEIDQLDHLDNPELYWFPNKDYILAIDGYAMGNPNPPTLHFIIFNIEDEETIVDYQAEYSTYDLSADVRWMNEEATVQIQYNDIFTNNRITHTIETSTGQVTTNPNTTELRHLFPELGQFNLIDESYTGKFLLIYQRQANTNITCCYNLWIYDVVDDQLSLITEDVYRADGFLPTQDTLGNEITPMFSSDDEWLVYHHQTEGIFIVNTNTLYAHAILQLDSVKDDIGLRWSYDSRKLYIDYGSTAIYDLETESIEYIKSVELHGMASWILSPSGNYILQSSYTLTDLRNDTQIEIPDHIDNGSNTLYAEWHPAEKWMIVSYNACASDCITIGGEVALYHISSGQFRHLDHCWLGYKMCAEWIPENVDISTLPAGQDTSMLLEPIAYEPDEFRYRIEQEGFATICYEEGSYEHALIDTRTDTEIIRFTLSTICSQPNEPGTWEIIASISPNQQYVYYGGFIYLYGGSDPIGKIHGNVTDAKFAEDSKYLRTRSFQGWRVWDVQAVLDYYQQYFDKPKE